MMTNDDDWVPTEEDVRHYSRTWFTESDMDRFLASVRREAKAEALREAAEDVNPYPTIRYTIPQMLRDRADEYESGDRT